MYEDYQLNSRPDTQSQPAYQYGTTTHYDSEYMGNSWSASTLQLPPVLAHDDYYRPEPSSHYSTHHEPYYPSPRYHPYPPRNQRTWDSYVPRRASTPSYDNRRRHSNITIVTRNTDQRSDSTALVVAPPSMGYRQPTALSLCPPHERLAQRFYNNELKQNQGAQWIMCDTARKFRRFEMNDKKITLPRNSENDWKTQLAWIWFHLRKNGGHGYIHVWHFKNGVPPLGDGPRHPLTQVEILVYEVTENGSVRLAPYKAKSIVARSDFVKQDLEKVRSFYI